MSGSSVRMYRATLRTNSAPPKLVVVEAECLSAEERTAFALLSSRVAAVLVPCPAQGVLAIQCQAHSCSLNQAAYKLLGLQSFFTAGEMEVKAWTVRQGATAPQAAGVIHTDFERGFIKAEVIGYDDYIELGGEQGAKAAGKLRIEGKDYVMADGDVVHFRFNV